MSIMPKGLENSLQINQFTSREYEKKIFNQKFKSCFNCNKPNTNYDWCQNCNSKWFQQDFDKWTSKNEFIDKFIQDAQLNAKNYLEVIEWIPYNHLRNIQKLAKGGFSIVYKAILLDGYINGWDRENKQLKRYFCEIKEEDYKNAKMQENIKSPINENEKNGVYVALKSLNNSSDDFLNEWKNYLKFIHSIENDFFISIQLYGITQDPDTLDYMVVMEYMELGSLRSNLTVKKYNPIDKYYNLFWIAKSLLALHKCNLVHGDLHSGNLLLQNNLSACISDLGLSKPADKPTKSDEIYGVLPYIAPEVLRTKIYTKAADIYSFGIIMWEMTSGIPAFNNVPHDFNLALSICQGLRPEIVEVPKISDNTEEQKYFEDFEVKYTELMKRCLDSNPDKRPAAEELYENFYMWYGKLKNVRIPVLENESIIPNHPLSYYISKKINHYAKLNKILNQEPSSKIIIEEKNEITSSECLEDCRI